MHVQPELSEVERLTQLRDELELKIHLAGRELRDEWSELERKREKLVVRLTPLRKAGLVSVQEVGSAARLLLEELRQGYERVGRALEAAMKEEP